MYSKLEAHMRDCEAWRSLKECVVFCGYHVYQEAWEAAVGEELDCERELNNAHDHYAVAVKRMEVVVGHLPCKLS